MNKKLNCAKLLVAMLAAAVMLAVSACGTAEETPKETTSVSQYKSQGNFPEVYEKLSWEKINSIPLKRADMTEDEMRQVVVDFYLMSKSFVWVADDNYTYLVADNAGENTLTKGGVYASFPYVSLGVSSPYRFMDYMDPETGVVNIKAAGAESMLLGNQCSGSCHWAWARVINSIQGGWTAHLTAANGYYPVGDYTYPSSVKTFSNKYGTGNVVEDNGAAVMFNSYAALKPGDGLVKNNPGGHVIMCTQAPIITYTADGSVNPLTSYIVVSDQSRDTGWQDYSNASGDYYKMTGSINKKISFQKAYELAYIPVTFKEYSGEDPIEETEITFSHTGETITKEQLLSSKVTSNYSISDIYAVITDSQGNEVYRLAVRAKKPSNYAMQFGEEVMVGSTNTSSIWGSWDNISADGEYTVQIIVQSGTGERPVIWEGKLVNEQ